LCVQEKDAQAPFEVIEKDFELDYMSLRNNIAKSRILYPKYCKHKNAISVNIKYISYIIK